MKKVVAYCSGSDFNGEELRRRMLRHQTDNPDCPRCQELGIDWATVEIEEAPMHSEYCTYSVVPVGEEVPDA